MSAAAGTNHAQTGANARWLHHARHVRIPTPIAVEYVPELPPQADHEVDVHAVQLLVHLARQSSIDSMEMDAAFDLEKTFDSQHPERERDGVGVDAGVDAGVDGGVGAGGGANGGENRVADQKAKMIGAKSTAPSAPSTPSSALPNTTPPSVSLSPSNSNSDREGPMAGVGAGVGDRGRLGGNCRLGERQVRPQGSHRQDHLASPQSLVLPHAPFLTAPHMRTGRGGRKPSGDPRMDPNIDPKKAKRILANRLSAAKSTMKRKMRLEALQRRIQGLVEKRSELEREVAELELAFVRAVEVQVGLKNDMVGSN